MKFRIANFPPDKNHTYENWTKRHGNVIVTVTLPLCFRGVSADASVDVSVRFTEPIKFQRKTTNPYQITPLKQNRSAALKMAFWQLFVFPNFPHFSGSNLSVVTCMDGK
jgi:hypothetical protein